MYHTKGGQEKNRPFLLMRAKMEEKQETTQEFLDRLETETQDVIFTDEEFNKVENYVDELIEKDNNSKGKIDVFSIIIATPICVVIAFAIAVLSIIVAIKQIIMGVVSYIKETATRLFLSLRR